MLFFSVEEEDCESFLLLGLIKRKKNDYFVKIYDNWVISEIKKING